MLKRKLNNILNRRQITPWATMCRIYIIWCHMIVQMVFSFLFSSTLLSLSLSLSATQSVHMCVVCFFYFLLLSRFSYHQKNWWNRNCLINSIDAIFKHFAIYHISNATTNDISAKIGSTIHALLLNCLNLH